MVWIFDTNELFIIFKKAKWNYKFVQLNKLQISVWIDLQKARLRET